MRDQPVHSSSPAGFSRTAVWSIAAALFFAGAAPACSGSSSGSTGASSPDGSSCTEGRVVRCPCSATQTGVQRCQPDGTWGRCRCDGSSGSPDIGRPDGSTSDSGVAPDLDAGTDGDASSDAAAPTPENYRTVEVAAGERKTFEVEPGEALENLLVDITADGANVFFDVKGGTLRDVGIKGEHPADGTLAHVTAPSSGGEAVVENVYAGDGIDGELGDATAFWVDATGDDGHRGVATFRNVHVAGFPDNGIYGSGPGVQIGVDEGGDVHIESCYAFNNNISNFRIGTNGSYVKKSVAVVPPNTDAPRHPNGRNARGVRAIEGATSMLVEHSEIFSPDWEAVEVDGHCTIRDTSLEGAVTGNATQENVDHDVDKTPPPGVPMTAKEAAQGL